MTRAERIEAAARALVERVRTGGMIAFGTLDDLRAALAPESGGRGPCDAEVLRLLEVYCAQHARSALDAAKSEPKGSYNHALRLGLANGYIGVKKLLNQPDRLRILQVETSPSPSSPSSAQGDG